MQTLAYPTRQTLRSEHLGLIGAEYPAICWWICTAVLRGRCTERLHAAAERYRQRQSTPTHARVLMTRILFCLEVLS